MSTLTVSLVMPTSRRKAPSRRPGTSSSSDADLEAVQRQLRVPVLLGRQGRLGQASLEGEDRLGGCPGLVRPRAKVAQLRRHVGLVGTAQRDRALVVVEVVAALGQAQPGLLDVGEVGARVLEVSLDADPEQGPGPHAVEVQGDGADIGDGRSRVDPVQEGAQRLGARGGNPGLVHPRGVVVAHEAADRVTRVARRRGLLEQATGQLLVAVVELDVRAPHRVLGRDRVGGEPPRVDVAVEVVRDRDGVVPERCVERLGVRHAVLLLAVCERLGAVRGLDGSSMTDECRIAPRMSAGRRLPEAPRLATRRRARGLVHSIV